MCCQSWLAANAISACWGDVGSCTACVSRLLAWIFTDEYNRLLNVNCLFAFLGVLHFRWLFG